MDPRTAQREREAEIERLAQEAGRLIRESAPETREQLAEAAAVIMRQESGAMEDPPAAEVGKRGPMNPMAAGLGLVVVGAGLSFLMPFVGVTLLAAGLLAFVWGAVISLLRR